MLWLYGYYKYFYSYSAGIDFRRQILTFNPFKPEFTNVILIHYKLRIAVAILDL